MSANTTAAAQLALVQLDATDFTEDNFNAFYYLYNHPANNTWMYHTTRTLPEFKLTYTEFFTDKKVYLLQLQQANSSTIIGTCAVKLLAPPRQHTVEITAVTLMPDLHGRSYGKHFFALLFKQLKADYPAAIRYELSYGLNNAVAYEKRFYEKLGFVTEAVVPDFFRSATPHYALADNPYQAWLTQQGGDLRHLRNCWYADEILAAYFTVPLTTLNNYKPAASYLAQPVTAATKLTHAEQSEFSTRLATQHDIAVCLALYVGSATDWGFLTKAALYSALENSIAQQTLWLLERGKQLCGAGCVLIAPPALEHAVVLQHIIVADQNAATSVLFFQNLITTLTQAHPASKRIEITLSAADLHLMAGLQANAFIQVGTLVGRLQTQQNQLIDEYVFTKSLFDVKDAISLCQNRLQAELFFKANPQHVYPFNLSLTPTYLLNLIQQLMAWQQTALTDQQPALTANQLYQLVKLICTQDLIPIEQRTVAMQTLNLN